LPTTRHRCNLEVWVLAQSRGDRHNLLVTLEKLLSEYNEDFTFCINFNTHNLTQLVTLLMQRYTEAEKAYEEVLRLDKGCPETKRQLHEVRLANLMVSYQVFGIRNTL